MLEVVKIEPDRVGGEMAIIKWADVVFNCIHITSSSTKSSPVLLRVVKP